MAGTDERGKGLTLRCNRGLLEGDPFVPGQHRLSDSDKTIALPHRGGDVRDFVALRLALLGASAQTLERLDEEGLDVVRLQPSRLGSLHLFANPIDPARVHGIVGERALLKKI